MKIQPLSRRNFLAKVAIIGGSTSISGFNIIGKALNPTKSDKEKEWLEKAKKVIASVQSIDLHTHLGLWEAKGLDEKGPFSYRGDDQLRSNIKDMIASGCKAAYVPITSDTPIIAIGKPGNKKRDFKGEEGWEEYNRQLSLLKEFSNTMPLTIATKIKEIDQIVASGKLAVLLSTEGGHMVEDKPERLEQLHKDGVRRFQPIHYAKTIIGDNQSDPAYFGGITPIGKTVLKEANRLKMVLDVAHASFQTTKQIADITSAPLTLSHTMMKYHSKKYGSYFYDYPRWISKDHAFLIAETGGVIGTWPLPKPMATENEAAFIEALMRMVDTVGINHVGWATDYIDLAMVTSKVFNNYRNFPSLCAKLLEKGFTEIDLAKFIGGNALRVQQEVVGE